MPNETTEPTDAEVYAARVAADTAWSRWTGGRSGLDGMEVLVRAALQAAAKVRSATSDV